MMRYISKIGLILSVLLICSCFYVRVDYPPEGRRAPMSEFRKNVPLSPGGTLSLENLNGNVEIRGWEKDELEVYAEKMIQLPANPKLYVFPGNKFSPGIVFDKFEDFVKIRTKKVSRDEENGFVDFFIDVPHAINLKDILSGNGSILISKVSGEAYLQLGDGDIDVENFSGSLTASTGRGTIHASLFDLREQDEIVISAGEGDIILRLQENAGARLTAEFPGGQISSEFDVDVPEGATKIDTQWGENGPLISLTAEKGNIIIQKIFEY